MNTLIPPMVYVSDLSPADQVAIAHTVLGGATFFQVARHYGLSVSQVRTILHRICLHANPDLYCETVKASVQRHSHGGPISGYVPSLSFLRAHKSAFGYREDGA